MESQAMPSSSDDKVYVNPGRFTQDDCPIIVLVDDLRGGLGWAIKMHTKGNYCHAMTLIKPGILASQNWLFETKGLDQYMKDGMMLKFWRIKNMTDMEKLDILIAIDKRLDLPWWKRRYDFIGTFIGQLIRVKWVQSPFAEFCSEQVNDDYINTNVRARSMGIKKPSPSELDRIFKLHPDMMECLGYWWDG